MDQNRAERYIRTLNDIICRNLTGIGEQNGGADCPCEEDEEMPPLEGEDVTEL